MINHNIVGNSSAMARTTGESSQGSPGQSVLGMIFILVGLVLVGLSVILPLLMEGAIGYHGAGGTFMGGYLRSLTPFVTLASMASSFVAAVAILSFEQTRPSRVSIGFGVMTLVVFGAELLLSAYLSTTRPQAGASQTLSGLYLLIGLVPFGLACTMFTLASIVSRRP